MAQRSVTTLGKSQFNSTNKIINLCYLRLPINTRDVQQAVPLTVADLPRDVTGPYERKLISNLASKLRYISRKLMYLRNMYTLLIRIYSHRSTTLPNSPSTCKGNKYSKERYLAENGNP